MHEEGNEAEAFALEGCQMQEMTTQSSPKQTLPDLSRKDASDKIFEKDAEEHCPQILKSNAIKGPVELLEHLQQTDLIAGNNNKSDKFNQPIFIITPIPPLSRDQARK